MNEYLIFILKKMCSYVNANFDEIDFKKDGWYNEYEWSKEEESEYMDWLCNEILNNKPLRVELLSLRYKPSKKLALKYVEIFNATYGWKIK